MRKSIPFEERFWRFVNKNGPIPMRYPHLGRCWLWTGCMVHDGYGLFAMPKNSPKRLYRAHRLAWILTKGDISETKSICHHCDVRNCVNPSHLFEGTNKENTEDMFKKGRHETLRGSDCAMSKLTEQIVVEIIMLRNKGFRYYEIAKRFGVNPVTVGDIIRGASWTHIKRVKYKSFIFVPKSSTLS